MFARHHRSLNAIGDSGAVSLRSLSDGAYSRPPLSVGLMMNTPMSRARASAIAGRLSWNR